MKQIFSSLIVLLSVVSMNGADIIIDVNEAVNIALENSEEMKLAQNAFDQAKLNRQIARTAYLPNFSGNLTTMWKLPDTKYDEMGIALRMKGMYMAGINLTQPIFVGGKIIASNKLAGIGKTVASEQMRLTKINVTANAMTTYWSYVAVLAKVEMMKSYRALVDTAYNQTKAALDAGMSTRNELLRIDARRSQVIYQQEQVSNGAELCRMALCNALGIALETNIEVKDNDIPMDLPANLGVYSLDARPEMQLLLSDIKAKEQQVKITRADFLPSLGLQAGWSMFSNLKLDMMEATPDGTYAPTSRNVKSDGWSIILSLQVPIFHWGEGYKKVKHAKIDVDNARLRLDERSRQLDLQVQQAVANVRTGLELVTAAQTSVAQAQAALDSTSEAYYLGMDKITDLLDAQAQWQTARASLIEAQTQLRVNIVDYLAATAQL